MASKARVEVLERQAREVLDTMKELLAESPVKGRGTVLADMLYRAELPANPDGYSRGTNFEPVSGSHPGSRPPAGALAAFRDDGIAVINPESGRAHEEEYPVGQLDVVAHEVKEMTIQLMSIVRSARRIRRKQQFVMNTAAALRGHQPNLGGDCVCCGDGTTGIERDRIVNGLDPKCLTAWYRYRDAHTIAEFANDPNVRFRHFIAARRVELAAKAAGTSATVPDEDEEWRITSIEEYRARGELPPQREEA